MGTVYPIPPDSESYGRAIANCEHRTASFIVTPDLFRGPLLYKTSRRLVLGGPRNKSGVTVEAK